MDASDRPWTWSTSVGVAVWASFVPYLIWAWFTWHRIATIYILAAWVAAGVLSIAYRIHLLMEERAGVRDR